MTLSPWQRNLAEAAIIAVGAGLMGACIAAAVIKGSAEWISAAAAIIQAVAAGLAIWFTVKLARESADREREADAAAVRRAEAAERAAIEQAAEADRRAVERADRVAATAYNQPLEGLAELGERAADLLIAEKAQFAAATPTQMLFLALTRDLELLRSSMSQLREKSADAAVISAANRMENALNPLPSVINGREVDQVYDGRAAELRQAAGIIRGALRN